MENYKHDIKLVLTWPSIADRAELADSPSTKLTNPNPLDLPVSLSVMTLAEDQMQRELSNKTLPWEIYNKGNLARYGEGQGVQFCSLSPSGEVRNFEETKISAQ